MYLKWVKTAKILIWCARKCLGLCVQGDAALMGLLLCGPGVCVSWSASGLGVGLGRRQAGLVPQVKYFY